MLKRGGGRRWIAGAGTAALLLVGLTAPGGSSALASATAAGQSYTVPCAAADVVTPALNANLIENPGAEDYTAGPDLGAPAADTLPDCWTVSSPLAAPDAVAETVALTYSGTVGARAFYGGNNTTGVNIAGITTKATQRIDVSSLDAGNQPFELSGSLGGYATQTDNTVVTATFQDANGEALGTGTIGPVTPTQRGNVSSLIPQRSYGTVPAGTQQVLITIVLNGVSSGADNNANADNLNLTIGSAAVQPQGQNYQVPCPTADAVTPALNANLIENPGAEDYTAATDLGAPAGDTMTLADCWTSASPLPVPDGTQESNTSVYPGVVGKRDFYGGASPSTVAVAGVVTTGTQSIDVSSLNAGGQPYELSGALGGYANQSDNAVVSAAFQDASGKTLGTGTIGPVTPTDRKNVSSLLPTRTYGKVPAGTTKVLITITTSAINNGANSDGAADDLNLTIGSAAAAPPQNYTVPCPAADVVTPALNTNLIENPGAEDYTAAADLGAPAGDTMTLADCWTSASPLPVPDGTQESNASVYPGVVGARDFYGGANPSTIAVAGVVTTGTQLIDVASLNADGQPFKLSAALGGYATQSDNAVVTATFQDSGGKALSVASIGPVTAAQRNLVSSLIPQAWYGTVPAGTTKVLITITTTAVNSGANSDGAADDLNLTIGSSAAASGPILQTLRYTAPGGSDGGTQVDPTTGAVLPAGGLYRPAGVSARNGVVYTSNTGDNVLAAMENGDTSVIAGSLEGYGEQGDGGKATASTMYQPAGTAVDAKGDIFIADGGDNVVREITPNGVIQRVAGTGSAGLGVAGPYPLGLLPPTRTALNHPQAVAVDAQGDVFIADTYNNRVLELTTRGRISTVAGTGHAGYSGDGGRSVLASLNSPTGLAVDAKGNLYIADSANNVIRRVDARTRVVTTVAGNVAKDKANDGLGAFSGDGGAATSAQLNDPQGVALDGAGDLFIADTDNNAIREVTPEGIISTVVNSAGTGGTIPAAGGENSGQAPSASHLNTPYAVAIDPSSETLYIADTTNSSIAEVLDLARPGSAAGPTAPAHH